MGGGGFFISDNSALETNTESKFATEKDVPASREIESSYLRNLREIKESNDKLFSNRSEDLIEGQGGGGFFIEDPESEAKETDPKICDQLNDTELDDIPDYYFKKDENGKLVYDPYSDGNQLTRELSCDDVSENLKDDSDFLIKDFSKEAFKQDHGVEESSKRIRSSEESNDVQEIGKNIIGKNDSRTKDSQESLSEIESSQGSFDKDIAEEEHVFGFEYSDTD